MHAAFAAAALYGARVIFAIPAQQGGCASPGGDLCEGRRPPVNQGVGSIPHSSRTNPFARCLSGREGGSTLEAAASLERAADSGRATGFLRGRCADASRRLSVCCSRASLPRAQRPQITPTSPGRARPLPVDGATASGAAGRQSGTNSRQRRTPTSKWPSTSSSPATGGACCRARAPPHRLRARAPPHRLRAAAYAPPPRRRAAAYAPPRSRARARSGAARALMRAGECCVLAGDLHAHDASAHYVAAAKARLRPRACRRGAARAACRDTGAIFARVHRGAGRARAAAGAGGARAGARGRDPLAKKDRAEPPASGPPPPRPRGDPSGARPRACPRAAGRRAERRRARARWSRRWGT
jgi:hypothetical protein